MSYARTWIAVLLVSTLALASGCERDGPAERAGEAVDDAVEDIRDGGEDLGNTIEDACEDLKEEAGAKDSDC